MPGLEPGPIKDKVLSLACLPISSHRLLKVTYILRKYWSLLGNKNINLFKRKKFVSTNGIEDFTERIIKSNWFTVPIRDVSYTLNEITKEKNRNLNCSWENVLCAIGALVSVVFDVLVGLNANDGFDDIVAYCFWVYHNHVIKRYDCFVKILLYFLDFRGFKVFNKRTFVTLCGVIREVKLKVYFVNALRGFGCLVRNNI